MIDKTGNYKFFKIRDISANLIEAFVEVFGENNRQHIERIIDETKFFPFHTFDYVNDKYLEKIKEYNDEIMTEFYKLSGLPRTAEIEFCLYPDVNGNNALKNEVYYHGAVLNTLTKKPVDYELYEDVCVAFDIHGEDNERRKKLNDIYRVYRKAVKKVEKKHNCQLFRDIDTYEKNLLNLTKQYINYAYKLDLVSDEDIEKIEDPDFDYYDLCTLDCHGKLFNFDFRVSGFVDAFKDKENTESTMINKLLYLYSNGVEPMYLTQGIIEKMFLNEYKNLPLLYKEYNYQRKNNSLYFVDDKDVKLLRDFRETNLEFIHNGCRFARAYYEDEYFEETFDGEYYVSNYLRCNNINTPVFRMVINCDNKISNQTLISNIIHEFMHCMGYFNYSEIRSNKYFRQDGVNVGKTITDKNGKLIGTKGPKTEMCEEFCNESLAKIVSQVYFKNFGVPELIEDGGKDWEYCLYDFYELLYGDFFRAFEKEIKEAKMHGKNLFAYKDYAEDVIELLISKFVTSTDRIFKMPMDGVIDVNEFMKLVELEPRYAQIIIDNIKNKNKCLPSDLTPEYLQKHLSPKDYKDLTNILKKKDKIIARMIADKKRFNENPINDSTIKTTDDNLSM